MVGYDAGDEWCGVHLRLPKNKNAKATSKYSEGLDVEFVKSAKIGVVRQLFGDEKDPYRMAVNRVVDAAIEKLRANGTEFVDVEIPDLEHYMYTTPTYLQSSRSDINSFLATRPSMPNDIADIVTPEILGTQKLSRNPSS
jgi:Asp-tRNA(Asn)/Glu-tRNA(Gln) amidotransferase A subunit family amidase